MLDMVQYSVSKILHINDIMKLDNTECYTNDDSDNDNDNDDDDGNNDDNDGDNDDDHNNNDTDDDNNDDNDDDLDVTLLNVLTKSKYSDVRTKLPAETRCE